MKETSWTARRRLRSFPWRAIKWGMRKMKDYASFLKALLETITEKTHFESEPNFTDILSVNPRLVVAINHSTALSWVPAICFLTQKTVEHGGGERIPRGIVDRFFYKVPGLRLVGEFVTQSDRPLSFDQLVQSFEAGESSDLVVFPEGSYSLTGDLESIHEFRSPRFVEFAIRTGSPILLAVHRGSESWALHQELPSPLRSLMMLIPSSFIQKIAMLGTVNTPWPGRKISDFRMHCELWTEHLQFRKLPYDAEAMKEKVAEEAERIRVRMSEIFEKL